MSLLSGFIASHVVTVLEKELLSHTPGLQEIFLDEIKEFTDVICDWLKEKLEPKA